MTLYAREIERSHFSDVKPVSIGQFAQLQSWKPHPPPPRAP